VRETSESVYAKGSDSGELAALGSLLCWGFPQVALRKIADWLMVMAQTKINSAIFNRVLIGSAIFIRPLIGANLDTIS